MKNFDVLIVGGGIAGLTASIYLKRANKNVAIIERKSLGGQILSALDVDNYPAFEKISGYELIERISNQVQGLGVEIIYDSIIDFDLKEKVLRGQVESYSARAIILAMGSESKPLGLKDESSLIGSGISYCATCDGAFFKNKDVLVAGSNKTAVEDVKYLSNLARTVYIADNKSLPKFSENNVVPLDNTNITALFGNPLNAVEIEKDGKRQQVKISGLFVAKGVAPSTIALKGQIKLDEKGYIETNDNMQTNIDGVFAAGDIRKKPLRQLITGASDGAIAGSCAIRFLKN